MSKNQCHKKVRITVNTFIPGVKGAVKASDGMTTHTIDALVRVDKEGNPIAVCKGPDYEGFVRSFGIDDLQYGVFIKDGLFVIFVYLDDANSLQLTLDKHDLQHKPGAPLNVENLKVFDRPVQWSYKVCAEKEAGAFVDEPCECKTHTDEVQPLPQAQKQLGS